MKIIRLALAFVIGLITMTVFGGFLFAEGKPRFEDYVVLEKFSGNPAKPVLSAPEAREYKTRIREAARGGPDFAGHFTVARWGCGSGCVMGAIVDAKTGKVFMLPFLIIMGPGTGSEAMTYKADSSLFIVNGSRGEEEEAIGPFYYRWDGKSLVLLN